MRHLTLLLTTLLLALGILAGPVSANGGGVSPEKLQKAGWTCITPDPHPDPRGIHCIKDLGAVLAGERATSIVMVFDPETGEFWGTELLIHQDLYNGQPCPQGDGSYVDLSGLGLPYFVCHHF